ncbi:hypothetical protein JA9_003578 [Meyerozyma sp. JA9]|nr:hypothetical protein JA9_003578 [Meyerozyma sp. JA9]
MVETNYKSYQQVINLSTPSKPSSRRTNKVGKPSSQPVKRRTKSGCLTCRQRKKKCDEDKVDGKCQACTRNFLQCCWPQAAVATKEIPQNHNATSHYPTPAASPITGATVIDSEVNYVMLPPRAEKAQKPKTAPNSGALSPTPSPRLTPKEEQERIKCQFYVTSVDNNRVCDINV